MPSHRELANAIRALAMDAVQRANSGHPGMPMGMADIAEVLWRGFLRHNPANPRWFDRDRFVLSNGHGSMLQYALLHLSGYDLPVEELRRFRQLHSRTPGHPEYGDTPGVETTTGPLGQGLANAVGMAIAERVLAARFNRDGHPVIDHRTWVFVGDGCLMEGISHEVCSLAGTLGLGKLIAVYDQNGISIDGDVRGWFTEDTARRFEAYGWHVIRSVDGHDRAAVQAALEEACGVGDRPSLVCCRTVIGFGAPGRQGTEAVHGAALGEEEVGRARERLGWHHPPFEIPPEIYAAWDARAAGAEREAQWAERLAAYREAHPGAAAELERLMRGELPARWEEETSAMVAAAARRGEDIATRKASQALLERLGALLPELIGGSADLTGSNGTRRAQARTFDPAHPDGDYIYYGVREFGMSAIMNGIVLHGGLIPYGGTFLTFSDYARNAVRMAALMGVGSVFVYTHDSIGLGEDGPTHQPIEHAAGLRLIPGMSVWRPCDAVESAVAWQAAIERRDGPTSLLFSRQTLRHQPRSQAQIEAIRRGGYILLDCEGPPEALLIATGSEVGLAVDAARELGGRGVAVRVVSMPSTDAFDRQDRAWRDSVLPPRVTARVSVEAGVTHGWYRYVGAAGVAVGIDTYGASAPAADAFRHFGFTVERVTAAVQQALARSPAEYAAELAGK